MKRILCFLLITVLATAGTAWAEVDWLLDPVDAGSAVDNLEIGKAATVYGFCSLTVSEFSFQDRLGYYQAGSQSVGSSEDYYLSGDEAEYAVLKADIENTGTEDRDFLLGCEVRVFYGASTYGGWAYQQNPNNGTSTDISFGVDSGVQNANWVINAADNYAIDPSGMGHYVFGCALPNSVAEGTDSLRLTITLEGHEFTYYIRKEPADIPNTPSEEKPSDTEYVFRFIEETDSVKAQESEPALEEDNNTEAADVAEPVDNSDYDENYLSEMPALEADNNAEPTDAAEPGDNSDYDENYLGEMYVVRCREYVTLREYANTKAPAVIMVPKGQKVEAYYYNDAFYRCRYNGLEGYILSQYLGEKNVNSYDDLSYGDSYLGEMYVVNCQEYVTLREYADTKAPEVAKVFKGQVVEAYYYNDTFCRCFYNGLEGYILSRYLNESNVDTYDVSSYSNPDDSAKDLNYYGYRTVVTYGRGALVFQKSPRGSFMKGHKFYDGDMIYVNVEWRRDGYAMAYDDGVYGYVDASYIDW